MTPVIWVTSFTAHPRPCERGRAQALIWCCRGHVHVPLCRPLAVRYGPEAGTCWMAVAGTATSYRIRGGHPNSVNVIRVDHFAGEVRRVLEQRDYDSERQAFRVAATRDLSDRVLTVITR